MSQLMLSGTTGEIAPVVLRPYQEEAVSAILDAWASGMQRPVVVMPTGTGKTVVFASALARRPGRALVVAHRDELLRQARDSIARVIPDRSVGIVRAEEDASGADIVVASIQTLARGDRLQRIRRYGPIETVVIDECHHATAPTYRALIDAMPDIDLLGVTATPVRADRVGLAEVFTAIVYEARLLDMIARGYLADVRAARLRIPIDLRAIRVSRGDYAAGALDAAYRESAVEERVAGGIVSVTEGRSRVLTFVPTVESAHRLAAAFRALGVEAASIDGTMTRDDRRAILDRYEAGSIRYLINCMILTEGFDSPLTDAVVLLRPTRSRALYQQIVGRALRPAPGKGDALIVDCVGAVEQHDLASINTLIGAHLPVRDVEEDALSGGGGAAPPSLLGLLRSTGGLIDTPDGPILVEEIDVFRRSWAHWTYVRGAWVLPLGDDAAVLMPTRDGLWTAWQIDPRGRTPSETIVRDVELAAAQELAEQRAEQARTLVDRGAAWRSAEPSAGQRSYLRALGVPCPPTRGEASEAITAALVGRRLAALSPSTT